MHTHTQTLLPLCFEKVCCRSNFKTNLRDAVTATHESCCLSQESKKRKKNDLSDDDGSWDNFQAELEKEMDEELAKNAKK